MCFRSGRQDRTGLIAAAFAADVKLKVALLLSNRSATGRDCSRVRGRPPKKIGPNLGKPPPERSGGLHNAPTVTLPACYFASRARRYLPSSAYFAYALTIAAFCKLLDAVIMRRSIAKQAGSKNRQREAW